MLTWRNGSVLRIIKGSNMRTGKDIYSNIICLDGCQQPWSAFHLGNSHGKTYFVFMGFTFSFWSPIEIFAWKEDNPQTFIWKRVFLSMWLTLQLQTTSTFKDHIDTKRSQFLSEKKKDLDNLFIINCVSSFFSRVNCLLESMKFT